MVPSSSHPSFPVGIEGWVCSGAGGDLGEIVHRGQKVFQRSHSFVFRITDSTSAGGAAMRVFARTLNFPPPWVGTGKAGSCEAVTGEAADRGSSLEG
jgi:hypothetical protein